MPALYPRDCSVTGIDLSGSMLEKARERVARKDIRTSGCSRWMPPTCKFADDAFDIVYAPYLISVVPDPVTVAREMRPRLPAGRAHHLPEPFPQPAIRCSPRIERAISPFTVHIGFKSDLDLPAFLAQAGSEPVSIEKVNIPRIWSLVTCVKE